MSNSLVTNIAFPVTICCFDVTCPDAYVTVWPVFVRQPHNNILAYFTLWRDIPVALIERRFETKGVFRTGLLPFLR